MVNDTTSIYTFLLSNDHDVYNNPNCMTAGYDKRTLFQSIQGWDVNDNFMNKMISIMRLYVFSPMVFFKGDKVYFKKVRSANIILIVSLFIYTLFFIALSPMMIDLIAAMFVEEGLLFTSNFKHIILVVIPLLGSVQFVSVVFLGLFTLHIFAILFNGHGTLKDFYIRYVFAVIPPLSVKIILFTVLSYFLGNNFFLVFIKASQTPLELLFNLIIDPFFWWGNMLGIIALKESYRLSYARSTIIVSTLLLLGMVFVFLINVF